MFEEGFSVRGSIHTKTTNGVDLSVRLMTRTTQQVITAPMTFLHVSALKNVFLQGHFNNFDLKALAENSLMRAKNEDIVTGKVRIALNVYMAFRSLVKLFLICSVWYCMVEMVLHLNTLVAVQSK